MSIFGLGRGIASSRSSGDLSHRVSSHASNRWQNTFGHTRTEGAREKSKEGSEKVNYQPRADRALTNTQGRLEVIMGSHNDFSLAGLIHNISTTGSRLLVPSSVVSKKSRDVQRIINDTIGAPTRLVHRGIGISGEMVRSDSMDHPEMGLAVKFHTPLDQDIFNSLVHNTPLANFEYRTDSKTQKRTVVIRGRLTGDVACIRELNGIVRNRPTVLDLRELKDVTDFVAHTLCDLKNQWVVIIGANERVKYMMELVSQKRK